MNIIFKLSILSTGTYRCHALHRGSGKWYELQDLHVTEILPQMITLSESYVQIWQRTSPPFKDVSKSRPNAATSVGDNKRAGDKESIHHGNNPEGESLISSGKRGEGDNGGAESVPKDVNNVEMADSGDATASADDDASRGLKRKLDEE